MADTPHKRVVLGVTGGIAAYKSPVLVRRLRERGCEVRVVMTGAATRFITPLTLQAVSGHPVHQELLSTDAESGMGHIELARWAERVIVAPASADFMARLAHGLADDLLATLCLATTAPIALAPAMNGRMWEHPATRANAKLLRSRGVTLIGPDKGGQACGESGAGRMTEPEEIAGRLLNEACLLDGIRVLITAGPTWEAIDPVRGLTNHSSGKMGFALAEAARDAGAAVTLVAGPVSLATPPGLERIDVTSAREMLEEVLKRAPACDIFIGVAAVADYRPRQAAPEKIKKEAENLTLELVRNPDILASVAALEARPFCVGFAAETGDLLANARKKLETKGLDLVAANEVGRKHAVFGGDHNAITLVYAGGETDLGAASKQALARRMVREIARHYRRRGKDAENG